MTDELDNITEDELYRATNGLTGAACLLASALLVVLLCGACGAVAWAVLG